MNAPFIIVLGAYLTLPGWALIRVFRIKSDLLLSSIALSYATFVACYIVFRLAGWAPSGLHSVMLALLGTSALIVSVSYYKKRGLVDFGRVWIPLAIALLVFIFHAIIGAHAEVPADIFSHMERFQDEQRRIVTDLNFSNSDWQRILLNQGRVWYHLLAMVAMQTSASSISVLESTAALTNSLFLLSVYCCALVVFEEHSRRITIALATAFFTATHMGINIFAFVRYYALAPTMIGFCLYLCAVVYFIRMSGRPIAWQSLRSLILIIIFILAAANNHSQETLFIVVMIAMMTWVITVDSIAGKGVESMVIDRKILVFASLLLVVGFFAIYSYAQLNLNRAPNAHWRLWEFGEVSSWLPSITTLNLKYQFARVMTLWGVFVYFLFFVNWQRYRHNYFLIAGMLSPIFTILNPFFVDLFLRLDNSTTLWRLCYLIPIYFVAGDLFVHYCRQLKGTSWRRLVFPSAAVALFLGLLLPIQNTLWAVHYSRFPTLVPIDDSLSYNHYEDLLRFLDEWRDPQSIVTDPVTGYIVSAMTKHTSPRKKFFRRNGYRHFSFTDYSDEPLKKYAGRLLLINLRDQKASKNGKLSGHWRVNELKSIHHYYPPQLLDHIEARPDRFQLIWNQRGISLYWIN